MAQGLEKAARTTVAMSALTPFLRVLEAQGGDVVERVLLACEPVLTRFGLSGAELAADPQIRLPFELVLELHAIFEAQLGDTGASLRAGAQVLPGDYILLEYLCRSAATLGQSIEALSRYYPLLIEARLELHMVEGRAEVHFDFAPGLDAPSAFQEFGVASNLYMAIHHLEPRGAVPPLEVRFAHSAPPHRALFEQIFPAPVRFDCEDNVTVFPARMLEHPLRHSEPALHQILCRQADMELAVLPRMEAFPREVRQAMVLELADGAPLNRVAGRLHISPSTLRARLRERGLRYSELVDDLRRSAARSALRSSDLSIAEVGYSLGFAHPPAFQRAFRRWFGQSPGDYRKGLEEDHPVTRFWRRSSAQGSSPDGQGGALADDGLEDRGHEGDDDAP